MRNHNHSFGQLADLNLLYLYKETGNEFAFNELYNRHYKKLRYIIYKFTQDFHLCQDYLQEIWLIVLEKCKIKDGDFVAWLYVLTKNYCIDKYRISKRNFEKLNLIKKEYYLTQELEKEEDYNEKLKNIIDVFDCLSKLQKEVVYYRLLGVKYKKISEILNVSKGTLTPAFTRAIGKLRRKLAEENKLFNNVCLSLRKYKSI